MNSNFPNLANKTFRDLKTNKLVKVIDSFDNIAILEGGGKVEVDKLLNTDLYLEYIDPSNFFNTQRSYDALFDKIKKIDTSKIKDDPEDVVNQIGGEIKPASNESAIAYISEEDEKNELVRKYGASIDNTSAIQKQKEAFSRLLGEESSENLPKTKHNQVNKEYITPVQKVQVDDPIISIFKKVKRGVDFKMNIEISDKIPRLDFIEMMEDSYEVSIIDYLADEFTNNLLKNPEKIKKMISDRIKDIVYAKKSKIKTDPNVSTSIQNTESESEIKEKTVTNSVSKRRRKSSKND